MAHAPEPAAGAGAVAVVGRLTPSRLTAPVRRLLSDPAAVVTSCGARAIYSAVNTVTAGVYRVAGSARLAGGGPGAVVVGAQGRPLAGGAGRRRPGGGSGRSWPTAAGCSPRSRGARPALLRDRRAWRRAGLAVARGPGGAARGRLVAGRLPDRRAGTWAGWRAPTPARRCRGSGGSTARATDRPGSGRTVGSRSWRRCATTPLCGAGRRAVSSRGRRRCWRTARRSTPRWPGCRENRATATRPRATSSCARAWGRRGHRDGRHRLGAPRARSARARPGAARPLGRPRRGRRPAAPTRGGRGGLPGVPRRPAGRRLGRRRGPGAVRVLRLRRRCTTACSC